VTQAQAALAQAEGQLGQAEATLQQLVANPGIWRHLHGSGTRCSRKWVRYRVRPATRRLRQLKRRKEANVTAGEKNVVAAKEFVRAGKATLDRLVTLQGYEKVTSPFAGIVTARNVDVWRTDFPTWFNAGACPPQIWPAPPTFRAMAKFSVWRRLAGCEFWCRCLRRGGGSMWGSTPASA